MPPVLEQAPRRRFLARYAVGSLLICVATAAAVATLLFGEVEKLKPEGPTIQAPVVPADPGEPQTILLLGSDKRPEGGGARSDTIILVRLDAERDSTAMLSLPRDLRVDIPGHG